MFFRELYKFYKYDRHNGTNFALIYIANESNGLWLSCITLRAKAKLYRIRLTRKLQAASSKHADIITGAWREAGVIVGMAAATCRHIIFEAAGRLSAYW